MTFITCLLAAGVLTLGDLSKSAMDIPVVTVEGDVIEAFQDDIDADYCFLLLKDGDFSLPVACRRAQGADLDAYVDSRVRVSGHYATVPGGLRMFSGPFLDAHSLTNVCVIRTAPEAFTVPELNVTRFGSNPMELAKAGRRRVSGTVSAVWNGNQLLLTTTNAIPIRVVLRRGTAVPPAGAHVTAVGQVTSDTFHYVLDHATCRTERDAADRTVARERVPIRSLYGKSQPAAGVRMFDASYDAKVIRIRGRVRSVPAEGTGARRLVLEDDGVEAVVDLSCLPNAAQDLAVGCLADVSGVYIIEAPLWNPTRIFPRINGFIVVPRSAADIVLVARPPWWTPLRLSILIGALAVLLLAAILWSVSLRILAERRGRALYLAQAHSAAASLRVEERTRLAVELHDALSQSLAGVALELKAVAALEDDRTQAREHLERADRSLLSCREELRNCLHDLRSDALEATTMDAAIARTLEPYVDRGRIAVRFNVPRSRLSDKTAHAILCIVRELALNAFRHGQATSVCVAGLVENEQLMFSVRDNGKGFDPSNCPGVRQGHFGLQGIRERVRSLGGRLTVDSQCGRGTKATIILNLPKEAVSRG